MNPTGATYPIGKASGTCAASGAVIAPGEAYMATLCEGETGNDLVRLDYAMSQWESGVRPERLFCFWRSVMHAAEDQRLLVDDDALASLFHRLEGEQDPKRQAYRFVISLILIRKRILRVVRSSGPAPARIWHVRMKGDDEHAPLIEVHDPDLTEAHVREVAEQLGEILRGNL